MSRLHTVVVCLGVAAMLYLFGLVIFAGEGRSGKWPEVRKAHLVVEPYCRVCGSERDLEVHHEIAFHERPELELDPGNLVTMCRHCHYAAGHLEISWKTNNCRIVTIYGSVSNSTGRQVWAMRRERSVCIDDAE